MLSRLRSLFVKKEAAPSLQMSIQPYKDENIDLEYNKMFCDNLALYRPVGKLEGVWKKIFAKDLIIEELKEISEDEKIETRIRILTFNELRKRRVISAKEVLGVVIEVGAEEGNEAIAVYKDLTARYINAGGKLFIWNNTGSDTGITDKIQTILTVSQKIISKAELWTEPRQAPPIAEEFRVSFLVADGFYVGEGQLAGIAGDAAAKVLIFEAGGIMVSLIGMARPPKPAEPVVPENISVNTHV